jgi:hypothetical protein
VQLCEHRRARNAARCDAMCGHGGHMLGSRRQSSTARLWRLRTSSATTAVVRAKHGVLMVRWPTRWTPCGRHGASDAS